MRLQRRTTCVARRNHAISDAIRRPLATVLQITGTILFRMLAGHETAVWSATRFQMLAAFAGRVFANNLRSAFGNVLVIGAFNFRSLKTRSRSQMQND